jgi:cytochrome b6-f complex subunit 4
MTETSLEKNHSSDDSIPFYPDHVRSEARVVIGITILVMFIGIAGLALPVGLGEPADPLNTPAHVKPEWYFLALYQILKFIPKTTGVVLPMLAILLVTIWPFLDRKKELTLKATRIRLIIVILGLIILTALTVWGEVS